MCIQLEQCSLKLKMVLKRKGICIKNMTGVWLMGFVK